MKKTILLASLLAGCTLQDDAHHGATSPDASIGSGSDPGSGSDVGSGSGSGSAVSCTPKTFDHCDGDTAVSCNATGDGFDSESCAHGCNPEHGCNVCTPNALTCEPGDVLQQCGADGNPASTETCPSGCLSAPTAHCEHIE